ncbi:hypothetical protein ACLMJK_000720 [Lecanora helva]
MGLKPFSTGEELLDQVMRNQEPRAHLVKDESPLHYHLETKLDERRKQFKVLSTRFRIPGSRDFSSNDILSLSSSGLLRKAWDAEIAKYPGVQIGSGGSRLLDGTHVYMEELEQRIAHFHKAEGAMILNSGCECNVAIFTTLPAKDDVILYDELVHASIHDGMASSKCRNQFRFAHNDLNAFTEKLLKLRDDFPNLKECKTNLFISLEAIYSMDGDITPLADMVRIAKEIFPLGNANFIVDEAHATGLLGDNGCGLVGMLGLDKEIALRVHTFSKALGSYGGVILSSNTIRNYMVNFSRSFMYTAAPAFSTVAAIKCAYDLMESPELVVWQHRIQYLVRLFCAKVRQLPHYWRARETNYLTIPVAEGFERKPLMSHIVPLWSPASDALSIGLLISKITAYPVAYPTVPKNSKRVRLVFHAGNTEEDIEAVVKVIGEWLDERFKGDTIAGVEAGFAGTWEDFGKIKGLKKDEPATNGVNGHENGLTNGHVNGLTNGHTNGIIDGQANGHPNGHFEDSANSDMHGIMSGATLGETVGATGALNGDKGGMAVITNDMGLIDHETTAVNTMANAIPVEINKGIETY